MESLFGSKDHVDLVQECTRAGLIFFYGLAMLRISGRRTFAQMSALDLVVSFMAGSALSRALTGNAPLPGTLAAVVVLIFLHVAVGHAVARWEWISRLVEGGSVRLGKNGHLDDALRRRHMISPADIMEALRDKGIGNIEDAESIHLEPSGKISVVKKAA